VWGIGRQWKMDRARTELINMGYGIELADEPAVCAAISQEFMASPSLTGLWLEAEKNDLRFFGITREHQYKSVSDRGAPLFGDLMIEKFERSGDDFTVIQPRSFIESKRARLWKVDLATGQVIPEGRQTRRICADILKLKRERDALKGEGKQVYLHVLVWGIYEEDETGNPTRISDEPITFFEGLRKETGATLDGPYLRWLPLTWSNPPPEVPCKNPVVRKSLWIALSEIDNPSGANGPNA
jgi:hypothetical protein